jgi:prepilin-type N-terminal cleavage/methylation domain-containing protein
MSGRERQLVTRKHVTASTVRRSSIPPSRGFTLIELLVVISILALLMAILLPTLQQARKQAKAVTCQATLRQWGIVFSMYMNEHDDRLSNLETVLWWRCSRAYYAECNDLLLCPTAARYEINPHDSQRAPPIAHDFGMGNKSGAWRFCEDVLPSESKVILYGGYGINFCVIATYAPEPSAIKMGRYVAESATPFLLDCVWVNGYGGPYFPPPAYDGDLSEESPLSCSQMKRFCIDRHSAGIHCLFMDWSVRKVGLKELWVLKWHRGYDTCGPWTKAGGVQAGDWPQWMRGFKEY